MKFQLLRKTKAHDDVLTRFQVLDSTGSIVGHIAVANEQANDLERHWLGGATPTQAAATGKKDVFAEALKSHRRPGSRPPAPAQKENPMVGAMLGVARKHRLTEEAILRGC